MSKKYLERATREGRVALLPEFLQPGREVWYWRESLCEEDGCPDMDSFACPLAASFSWHDEEARACARQHPVLEKGEIWDVRAVFTGQGVEWIVNDLPPVPDWRLRSAFFTSKTDAMRHRPGEVV